GDVDNAAVDVDRRAEREGPGCPVGFGSGVPGGGGRGGDLCCARGGLTGEVAEDERGDDAEDPRPPARLLRGGRCLVGGRAVRVHVASCSLVWCGRDGGPDGPVRNLGAGG